MEKSNSREKLVEYENMPRDYVVWSVFSIIFFNTIFGLVAFYYSIKTRDLFFTGNLERAQQASKNARIFNIVSVLVSVILFLCLIAYYIYALVSIIHD